jgi:flagellar biosynthesis protein FliP
MEVRMDAQQNDTQLQFTPEQISQSAFLILASICSVLSLLCSCFVFSTLIFGSLAIIFATLSKGSNEKMTPPAKVATWMAVTAMCFSLFMTASSVYQICTDPETYAQFEQQYESMTQHSLQEDLDALRGLYQ